MQQLGRGTRRCPGKDDLLVVDFVDNANMFNMPYSLHRVLDISKYQPMAYVLARYGHAIGNDDLVWWSYPLAEIASLLVTLVFFRRLYRTLIAPLPANGGAPVHDDSDDDPIGE